MKLFDDDPDIRWLFCMTHPDDEIAIAAWIKRLCVGGREVWLSWTHDTPIRESEARVAAGRLGVDQDRLVFFHAHDREVVDHLKELLPQYRDLITAARPSRVVCPAFEQGHLDHDATNLLVNRSYDGLILETPLYHTYLTPFPRLNQYATPEGEEVLSISREERAFKFDLARSYRSQSIARNIWWANAREAFLGRELLGMSERLRVQKHSDFLRPNLPDQLAQRVANSKQWSRWLSAVRAIL